MSKSYFLFSLFLVCCSLMGWSQSATINVNGVNRTYLIHLPPGHDTDNPAPLVINYHGYTSNAGQQAGYTQMQVVADTAGFILVHPEGLNASWNSFSPLVTSPDDVAFTSAIIDHVNGHFAKVDAARVYACGMSNGGYMSYLLGCELEDRITAVASVTGLLAPGIMAVCNPSRPVPVLQIHGTNDMTVPYNGSTGGSVNNTIQFWQGHNNCPTGATVIDTLPNTNPTDNSYPIRYTTAGCDAGTEVTLIKIVDGGHTWPNGAINLPGLVTNRDINGSTEVWNFFAKFTHPNPAPLDTTAVTSTRQVIDQDKLVKAYPNPMGNQLTIEVTDSRVKSVALYDVLGAKIYEASISQHPARIQFSTVSLQAGIYFLRVETGNGQTTYKLMK